MNLKSVISRRFLSGFALFIVLLTFAGIAVAGGDPGDVIKEKGGLVNNWFYQLVWVGCGIAFLTTFGMACMSRLEWMKFFTVAGCTVGISMIPLIMSALGS